MMLFCTARHAPDQVLAGAREVVGPAATIWGGSAIGVVTNEVLAYGGPEVGAAVVVAPGLRAAVVAAHGLPADEAHAGRQLGERVRTALPDGASALLIYDTVSSVENKTPSFVSVTPLVRGFGEPLGPDLAIAGLGAMGDVYYTDNQVFADRVVERGSAAALVLPAPLRMDTITMHGLRPASRYFTITRTDGAAILELDGAPALARLAEVLGPVDSWQDYPNPIVLGANQGDRFGPFHEEDYINRVCLHVDEASGAILLYEPDLEAGMSVQVMRRSLDFDYVRARVAELLDRVGGRRRVLALYINCSGRAAAYGGGDGEDAAVVQASLGDVPLLGVYGGGEVARVGGELRALDWTGVLCLFTG
jgi:hypothetical protein